MVSLTLRCAWTQSCTQNLSAWTSVQRINWYSCTRSCYLRPCFCSWLVWPGTFSAVCHLGTTCLGNHSFVQELVGEIVRLIGKSKGIKTSIQFLMHLFFFHGDFKEGEMKHDSSTNKLEFKCVYSRVPRVFSLSMISLWRRSWNIELCYVSQSS